MGEWRGLERRRVACLDDGVEERDGRPASLRRLKRSQGRTRCGRSHVLRVHPGLRSEKLLSETGGRCKSRKSVSEAPGIYDKGALLLGPRWQRCFVAAGELGVE